MSLNIGVPVICVRPLNRITAATNSALVTSRLGRKLPSGIPVTTPAFAMVDIALLNQLSNSTSVKGLSWRHRRARSVSEERRNSIVVAWARVVVSRGRTVPSVNPIMNAS